MKPTVIAVLLLLLSSGIGARAADAPPLTEPTVPDHAVTVGSPVLFSIRCKEVNDRLIAAGLDITTPKGEKILKPPVEPLADIHTAFSVSFTPTESGEYQYHFFAQDANGKSFEPTRGEDILKVQPNWFPWAIMGGGFILSFLIISTLVYQVMHRGMGAKQTSAARVAVMLGAVCWMLSILYAWNWLTNIIAWVIGGVAVLLLLVWAVLAK